MTAIYWGVGVGFTAALAYGLYKYLKGRCGEVQASEQEAECESIRVLDYETLMKWLSSQYKLGNAMPGDSFVVFQNVVAGPMCAEIFPKKTSMLVSRKCLAVSIVRDDVSKAAKFYIYDEMSESLSDMLPDDENTAYVQNLTD